MMIQQSLSLSASQPIEFALCVYEWTGQLLFQPKNKKKNRQKRNSIFAPYVSSLFGVKIGFDGTTHQAHTRKLYRHVT